MIRQEDIQRQNVVWVDLGSIPNEARGHEQATEQGKPRPCLIIKVLDSAELAIIIPFTTTQKVYPYYVVKVDEGVANLTEISYALCHQIRTVSYERFSGFIGTLPDADFWKVLEVLADFLEL